MIVERKALPSRASPFFPSRCKNAVSENVATVGGRLEMQNHSHILGPTCELFPGPMPNGRFGRAEKSYLNA